MNCNPELLSAYYDGEVVGEQRRLIEEHLKVCASCAALLNEYRRISRTVHNLPLAPVPFELEDEVFDRVSNVRRGWLQRLAAPVIEVAAVAAAAVLVVVVMSQVLPGMNTVSGPAVSAATPGTGCAEVALNAPILVSFDRKMDHKSVESSVAIDPPLNVDYLWQGEDLLLVPKEPLKPETTYSVSVAESARDDQGHGLRDPFSLRFTTARNDAAQASAVAANTTPAPSATTPQVVALLPQTTPAPEGDDPVATMPSGSVTPKATPETSPSAQATPQTTAQATPESDATATAQAQAQVQAQATMSTLERMATASATKAAGLPTAVAPRATATGSAVPGCEIQPVRGFGLVYEQNAPVRELLGCAVNKEQGTIAARQDFEHGQMLWLSDLEVIYVLDQDGDWMRFPDTWSGEEPENASLEPPEGLGEPARGFGKVWREEPGLREELGWALAPEQGFVAGLQDFARGLMIWTDEPAVYVIGFDGSWERFADSASD